MAKRQNSNNIIGEQDIGESNATSSTLSIIFAKQSFNSFLTMDFCDGNIQFCLSQFPYDSKYERLLQDYPDDAIERLEFLFEQDISSILRHQFFSAIQLHYECSEVIQFYGFLSDQMPELQPMMNEHIKYFSVLVPYLEGKIESIFENLDATTDMGGHLEPEYEAFLNYKCKTFNIEHCEIGEKIAPYLSKRLLAIESHFEDLQTQLSSLASCQISLLTHALEHGYHTQLNFLAMCKHINFETAHGDIGKGMSLIFDEIDLVDGERPNIVKSLCDISKHVTRHHGAGDNKPFR